jgi:putative Ca2+/H+ antiporter (TMEM165/GDT1 family)
VATTEVNSGSTSGAVRDDPAPASKSARVNGSVNAVHQREEFGGLNWGAAVFGWLVAVGIAAILTAFVSAAGAAVGLTDISSSEAKRNAATIGIGGAVALLIVLLLAYYAGGYVAGRMSRFNGGRQGFGTWLIGVIITILLGAAGALLGSKYNVLSALNLPRIPVQEGTVATGAAITLAAVIVGTLIAAVLGGRIGRRYHRKVDRAALT